MSVLPQKLLRILLDLLPIGRPRYCLAVGSQYVCFFEIRSSGKLTVLRDTEITGINGAVFTSFLNELRKNGIYFGQEITLLFLEPETYAVIRSAGKFTLEELRAECRKLQLASTHQKITQITLDGKDHYVISGVNEEFAKAILEILKQLNFLVGQVSSLSGFIIQTFSNFGFDKDFGISMVTIGRCISSLGQKENREVFYFEKVTSGAFEKQMKTPIVEIFPAFDRSGDNVRPILFRTGREPAQETGYEWRDSKDLFAGIPSSEKQNRFTLRQYVPREVRRMLLAAGSARLLAVVMIALVLVFGLTSIVFRTLKADSEDVYDKYQDRLAGVVSLESEISAIDSRLQKLGPEYIAPVEFSGYLSLFCQRIPWRVFVTDLRCERKATGNVAVLGRGQAQRESSIFSYREFVSEFLPEGDIRIESISRATHSRVPHDTVWYQFELSIE